MTNVEHIRDVCAKKWLSHENVVSVSAGVDAAGRDIIVIGVVNKLHPSITEFPPDFDGIPVIIEESTGLSFAARS